MLDGDYRNYETGVTNILNLVGRRYCGQLRIDMRQSSYSLILIRILNQRIVKLGRTPLSWAAWNCHEATTNLLLKTNLDIESKDTRSWTLLS
jgi:hypothetical protein